LSAGQPRRDVFGDDFSGCGEPFPVRKLLPVVDDVNLKANLLGELREMSADVAGADDVQLRRRFDGLDVNVHLSAANKS